MKRSFTIFFGAFFACLISVVPTNAQRGSSGGLETRQERAQRTDSYNRAVDNLSGRLPVPASNGMRGMTSRPLDGNFRKAVLATQVTIQAKVIDVVDGDTIYVKINERVKLLRLTGADAPDLGQPNHDSAVEFMKRSLLNKDVLVHYSTYGIWDLDGVPLVTISDGDTDVGLRLIENGMAWFDEAHQFYLSKTSADLYKTKCKEARDNKTGLWGDRSPEKPSDYRHRLRIEERKRLAAKKP